MSEDAPTVFGGRYELHQRIARGGMADVYLARDRLLDRWVAVKVLFAEFAADPTFVERFRREAQAAAKLSHPNIVAIYDWGEERGTYFIVMEYIEGLSLSQVLKHEGKMSAERAADIAMEVAQGLGYAHSQGFIHLDTKSANVLMSQKGEIKVADFGIAKAIAGGAENNLTQTGSVMGTATYFSPEQAQGRTVGPQSDLYSLGVVLYEMLVGRPPFVGDTPVAIAYKHVQEQPPPPSDFGVEVPHVLAAITRKLLAKNPENRYHTAEDLVSDLRRFRAGEQIAPTTTAPPAAAAAFNPNAPAPSGDPSVGAPPVYGPGGASGPPTTAATTAMPVQQPAPDGTQVMSAPPDFYEPPPRDRRGPGAIIAAFLFGLVALVGIGILGFVLTQDDDPEVEAVNAVEVPSVFGLDEAQAVRELQNRGLNVEVRREINPERTVGTVFGQQPAAATQAGPGDVVLIVVSAGEETIAVPSVVGIQEQSGRGLLEGDGFVVDVAEVASEDIGEGQIVSQDPAAGSQLPEGALVRIEVSVGPPDTPIPDVKAFSVELATQTLQAEGFRVLEEEVFNDDILEGAVVGTDPPAFTEFRTGEFVTLQISKGPELLLVPSVLALSELDAVAELQLRGFVVAIENVTTFDPLQNGFVIDQIPLADTEVEPSSSVRIQVGVFVEPTPTPVPLVPTPFPTPIPTIPPAPTAVPTLVPTLPPVEPTATPVMCVDAAGNTHFDADGDPATCP